MAEINIKDVVGASRETVFSTFRDELVELLPHLPDVKSIEVKEREEPNESTVKVVNLWKADAAEIPRLAQAFVKPEMLEWTDYATWNAEQWTCEWEMEVGFLSEAVTCKGTTTYAEKGDDRTEVVIRGDLTVDARKIPGVPRIGAGKIGDVIEGFVVRLITPNLTQVNRGLESYLRARE
jgi:hypothetical protein